MPHPITILSEDDVSLPGVGRVTGIIKYWPPHYGDMYNPPEQAEVNVIILRNESGDDVDVDLDDDITYNHLLSEIERLLYNYQEDEE